MLPGPREVWGGVAICRTQDGGCAVHSHTDPPWRHHLLWTICVARPILMVSNDYISYVAVCPAGCILLNSKK